MWNPETGLIFDAPVWEMADGNTMVDLNFEAFGSIFVVFKTPAITKNGLTAIRVNGEAVNAFNYIVIKKGKPVIRLKETGEYEVTLDSNHTVKEIQSKLPLHKLLNDNWAVSFQEKRGAPANANFDRLISYTEHPNKGIRYFSGKATYHKTFTITSDEFTEEKGVFLDLGQVKNVATIIVNGKKVMTFWKPPFAIEITAWCKAGENSLAVEVTNLWPNRMIGDEQEPDDCVWGKDRYFTYVTPNPKIGKNLQVIPDWVKQNKERPSKNRVTFTTMKFFDKDDPLLPSGLLGPVTLSIENIWKIS